MFRQAFIIIKHIIENLGPFWFINLNQTMERFIRMAATNCGEFFCSTYWIKGMLSNYLEVAKAYRKASAISKSVKNRKANLFNINYENWSLTRFSWPRAVFISSALSSPLATREAYCAGIPCLAIVDTDTKSQAINLAIPGNDDSLDSIIFYNEVVSSYVLLCKFSRVFLWFVSVRNKKRLAKFNEWLLNVKIAKKQYFQNWFSYHINSKEIYSNLFYFMFSKSYWQNKKINNLRVFL
jgi:ribosomal protein S2